MPKTVPGRATYRAFRLFGATSVIATGETPNINDKVDLRQLPFLIFPPMFEFVFIQQDVSLPTVRPFTYEETIIFPAEASIVTIHDADGVHNVPIAEVVAQPMPAAFVADDRQADHCVFGRLGTSSLMIAKCDAILPAIYRRVFGPDTFPACEAYIAKNGAIAV